MVHHKILTISFLICLGSGQRVIYDYSSMGPVVQNTLQKKVAIYFTPPNYAFYLDSEKGKVQLPKKRCPTVNGSTKLIQQILKVTRAFNHNDQAVHGNNLYFAYLAFYLNHVFLGRGAVVIFFFFCSIIGLFSVLPYIFKAFLCQIWQLNNI